MTSMEKPSGEPCTPADVVTAGGRLVVAMRQLRVLRAVPLNDKGYHFDFPGLAGNNDAPQAVSVTIYRSFAPPPDYPLHSGMVPSIRDSIYRIIAGVNDSGEGSLPAITSTVQLGPFTTQYSLVDRQLKDRFGDDGVVERTFIPGGDKDGVAEEPLDSPEIPPFWLGTMAGMFDEIAIAIEAGKNGM